MDEEIFQKEYLKAFGKSLKALRQTATGKSLRLFAYEADIPCATLSRLENGTRMANIITLKKIAVNLDCSLAQLLERIENDIPDELKNFDL